MSEPHTIDLEFRTPDLGPDLHRVMTWRGFTVEHASLTLPNEYEFSWHGDTHYLASHDIILDRGEMRLDSQDPIVGRDLRNKLTFAPEGQSLSGWAAPARRKNSFTIVNFMPGLVSEELEIAFRDCDLGTDVYFEDERLAATMRKIERQLIDGGPGLYIETLGLLAALEIANAQSESLRKVSLRRGGLNRAQMAMLTEYIDTHLAEDVSLDRLAGLVRLSRFHFSRSFKAAFGMSPVKYVTGRRLAKARLLLAGPRMGLSEVAGAVGFGSVQQFIKVFREDTRMTPGEYRRNL